MRGWPQHNALAGVPVMMQLCAALLSTASQIQVSLRDVSFNFSVLLFYSFTFGISILAEVK